MYSYFNLGNMIMRVTFLRADTLKGLIKPGTFYLEALSALTL